MNNLLKIIIKELLLYWLLASIILLCYAYYINTKLGYIFKICCMISILSAKINYENYIAKFYSNNIPLKKVKNKVVFIEDEVRK